MKAIATPIETEPWGEKFFQVINAAVGKSGTDHKDTTTLETPAESSDLDKPITPSPVIFPLPVLQAFNTTKRLQKLKN